METINFKGVFNIVVMSTKKIDWVETDHAPHRLSDKLHATTPASGIPGLPFYPHFVKYLLKNGFTQTQIHELTHKNICSTFQIDIPENNHSQNFDLSNEYDFDPYRVLK